MIQVVKKHYSRSPWRLVDQETGAELGWMEPYPANAGDPKHTYPPVWVSGFDTKAEALEFMGRLLARLLRETGRLEAVEAPQTNGDTP
jgi:hypothetical protein